MTEIPCIRNGLQRCENLRNSLGLNFESPALTAELQAHFQVRSSAAACTLYPPGRLDAKRTGRLLTSLGVNTTPVCRA